MGIDIEHLLCVRHVLIDFFIIFLLTLSSKLDIIILFDR